jgi:hypothetical protein
MTERVTKQGFIVAKKSVAVDLPGLREHQFYQTTMKVITLNYVRVT